MDLQAAWSILCEKLNAEGYDSLSEDQRLWIRVRELLDAVKNGGAISYYYNPGADHLADCVRDLQTLGAGEMRALLAQVSALFGEQVPSDIDGRNAIIDSWSDEDDSVDSQLERIDAAMLQVIPALERALEARVQQRLGAV